MMGMMFGHSWIVIVILLVIVLIIFGPGKLPELGKTLGSGIREFRDSVTHINAAPVETAAPVATTTTETPTVTPLATVPPRERV